MMMEIGFCSPPFSHDITTEVIGEKSGIVELTSHHSADSLGHAV
jgi:hypothetical protein